MKEIFGDKMWNGINHCKLLNAFFQKLQEESQAKDEYCIVLCDEFELEPFFEKENVFNFSDLEVPSGTDGKDSRIFPIICAKPTFTAALSEDLEFKMPQINGLYVKELKMCYRACKQNQEFYRFWIENAKTFGFIA